MEIRVSLRAKNQLTLPEPIVRRLGLEPGDNLIVEMDEDQPEVVRIRPVRRSYAGVARGVYGTREEAETYVQREREAWDR